MTLRYPDVATIEEILGPPKVESKQSKYARSYHAGASTALHDPLHGGTWIMPKDARFVGTLSAIVNSSSGPLLLSNRHVFYMEEYASPAGGALWSPPAAAGNKTARVVGYTRGRKLPGGIFFPTNRTLTPFEIAGLPTYFDAAIASVNVPYTYDIPGIGVPTGHTEPRLGMNVTLVGGKSGLNKGKITNPSVNYKMTKQVPAGQYAYVRNAFIHSCVSTAGDSGSMVIETATKKVVGLHYAGDDAKPEYNIGCRASAITRAFGIDFKGKPGVFTPSGYKPPTTPEPGQTPSTSPPGADPIIALIKKYPIVAAVGGIIFVAIVGVSLSR
jgi:hypothetical protein